MNKEDTEKTQSKQSADALVLKKNNTMTVVVVLLFLFLGAAVFALVQNGIIGGGSSGTSRLYGASCTFEGKTGRYDVDGLCTTCSDGTAEASKINNNCSEDDNGDGIYCCGEAHTYGAPCTTLDGETGRYGAKGTCIICSSGTVETSKINNNCSEDDNGDGIYCCGEAHSYGAPCTYENGTPGLYGTDGLCYGCSSGSAMTSRINDNCSQGLGTGVYCCVTGGGGGGDDGTGHAYCNPGNTYNYSDDICCPNSAPHYYNGAHGIYGTGCYASCPYIGDCSSRTTRY